VHNKRCPVCDLLVDEEKAHCGCSFQFFDDTPNQVITAKRIIITSTLLMICLWAGTKLGAVALKRDPYLALITLSIAAFSLNLLPNIRKQGAVALSMAMAAVLWTSFYISNAYHQVHQGDPKPNPVPATQELYDGKQRLSMGGLTVESAPPKKLPNHLEVVTNDWGEISWIAGGSLTQGGTTLLQPGDTVKRVKARFPTKPFGEGILHLTQPETVFVEEENGLIKRLYLMRGHAESGHYPEVDGIRKYMAPNLARILARRQNPQPRVFAKRKYNRYRVCGIQGDTVRLSTGTVVKKGQKREQVPDLNPDDKYPYITIKYDENDQVSVISFGEIQDGTLTTPTILPELAKTQKLELIGQTAEKVSRDNELLHLSEQWHHPNTNLYLKRRPIKDSDRVKNEPLHQMYVDDKKQEATWKLGEQSYWNPRYRGRLPTFIFHYRGMRYKLIARDLPPNLELMKKLAAAIIETQDRLSHE